MFNFSGSEIVFLLLLALIILGPEKLPEAVRKFGRTYAEFKKVSTGFQAELREALDEPVREMRETAELFKQAATFDVLKDEQTTAAVQQQVVPDEAPSAAADTAADTGAAPPLAAADAATGATPDATPAGGPASVVSGPLVQRMRSLDDVVAAPRRTVPATPGAADDTGTAVADDPQVPDTGDSTVTADSTGIAGTDDERAPDTGAGPA